MIGRFPATFILCRKVQAEEGLFDAGEEPMWTEYDKLSEELSELIVNLETGSLDHHNLKDWHPNLLDLKCELVNRMLEHCDFCEKVLVNAMAQYYAVNMVARTPEKYPEIARYPSRDEIQQAYSHARALNLQFEQVS